MLTAVGDDCRAVLDACVLAPMPLCDTLLRCAEEPALYRARWSEETLNEVARTLRKFGYSREQAARRIRSMQEAFPEAMVSATAKSIDSAAAIPHPEDRHVAAAAIQEHARVIVTANLRHFPQRALAPHCIVALSPDDFLVRLSHLNRHRILEVLDAQARATGQTPSGVLDRLRSGLPLFSRLVEQMRS